MIHVELYEGARQIAGVSALDVEARTLGDALDAVRAAHPQLEPRVLVPGGLAPHWRVSVGGRQFVEDPATPLEPGETLLLVSALAGG